MLYIHLFALSLLQYARAACPDGSALKSTSYNKDTKDWAHWLGPEDAFNAADMTFDMPASNAQIDIKKVLQANTAIRKNQFAFNPVADPPLKLTTDFKLQCEGEGQGTVGAMIGFAGKNYQWFFQLAYAQDRFMVTVYATDGEDWHQGLNGKFEEGLASEPPGNALDTFFQIEDTVVKDSVCGDSGYSFQVTVTDVSFILSCAKVGEEFIKMVEYTPKEVLVPSSKEGGLSPGLGGYWMTPDDQKRLVSYSEVKVEGCQIGATAEQPLRGQLANVEDDQAALAEEMEATSSQPSSASNADVGNANVDNQPAVVVQTSSKTETSEITSSPKPTPPSDAEKMNDQRILTVYNTVDVPKEGAGNKMTAHLVCVGIALLVLCCV